jgi:hypothetical protein
VKLDDLVTLCESARVAAYARDVNLPDAARAHAAMASALRVAASKYPAVAKFLEGHRPATNIDELERPRLMVRARPHIDAVLCEVNVQGDVTERMLLRSAIPWVVPHRDRLCWLLSREDGMTQAQIALVVGCDRSAIAYAIRRHVGRMREELGRGDGRREGVG